MYNNKKTKRLKNKNGGNRNTYKTPYKIYIPPSKKNGIEEILNNDINANTEDEINKSLAKRNLTKRSKKSKTKKQYHSILKIDNKMIDFINLEDNNIYINDIDKSKINIIKDNLRNYDMGLTAIITTENNKIMVNSVIQFIFSNIIYLLNNIKSLVNMYPTISSHKTESENVKIYRIITNDLNQIYKSMKSFKIENMLFHIEKCIVDTNNKTICDFYYKYFENLLELYIILLENIDTYLKNNGILDELKTTFGNDFKLHFNDKTIPNFLLILNKYVKNINKLKNQSKNKYKIDSF